MWLLLLLLLGAYKHWTTQIKKESKQYELSDRCQRWWGSSVPQTRSQDSITDDEVKFFQVGSWAVLKHAVAMETVLTISQALGNLQSVPPWCSSLCMWKLHQVLPSHLLCDLGFLLQGQRHQLVPNTVLFVGVTLRSLKRKTEMSSFVWVYCDMNTAVIPPPYLPFSLQCLQLSLVGFLSQCLVNLGHDWDFLATVSDGRVVFGLW